MRVLCFICNVLIFVNCDRGGAGISNKTTIDTVQTDTTSVDVHCIQTDTITASGTKIQYVFRDGKFQIS